MSMDDEYMSSKEIEEKGFRLWERFQLDEALKVFSEGLRRFPADRKIRLGLAFTRLDLGDLPEARQLFENLLDEDSKDDECWWGLGRIHLLLSNYGEARYCFDQAQQVGKADERILLDVAREWYLLSYYEEAQDFYRKALQVNEESPEALLGVGACLYWLHEDGAEEKLKSALELDESYYDCRNFLANMYYSQRRYDEALASFEKIPLQEQGDPVSLRRMLRLLRARKRPQADIQAVRETLKKVNREQSWDFFLSQIRRRGGGRG